MNFTHLGNFRFLQQMSKIKPDGKPDKISILYS
jgi:hypothetical protein